MALTTNYDVSKIFLKTEETITADYTNGTGSAVEIPAGRVMGRVAADNKVKPQAGNATDGSEVPVLINMVTVTVANGATKKLTLLAKGTVAANKLTLNSTDTLATAVNRSLSVSGGGGGTVSLPYGTIGDNLRKAGIYPIESTELTDYDNQ